MDSIQKMANFALKVFFAVFRFDFLPISRERLFCHLLVRKRLTQFLRKSRQRFTVVEWLYMIFFVPQYLVILVLQW